MLLCRLLLEELDALSAPGQGNFHTFLTKRPFGETGARRPRGRPPANPCRPGRCKDRNFPDESGCFHAASGCFHAASGCFHAASRCFPDASGCFPDACGRLPAHPVADSAGEIAGTDQAVRIFSGPGGRCARATTPPPTSLRGGAADAAIQFHPLTVSQRIDIVTTRKAKPLDCRVGCASSQ